MFDAIHFMIIKSPIWFTVIEAFLLIFTAASLEMLSDSHVLDSEAERKITVCVFYVCLFMLIFIPYMWLFYVPSYF
ncbi:hypothetical protein VPFG_00282 [Vibrio phage nt-1]|uniref:Transmembrane protein n=1 Tax=Vibrio phage nt-1 TaxID=115992 RepID=R9TER7_9CAUD|nr:hypothetical protein VPFG_00282 [Vibrio phage nt-1]AGN30281.1 hypothetical protein VPFG_00282 [Vibrio phage nt-1]